ncbi:HAD hydrolase-like protein [Geminocystis sp. NIES-3709]|uniref:HAD hydrolase-like protein n=1 Tax=Geminocystis sp. NIES-3709 TaxID=1617448 RepID=UPI0005FCC3F4|nr:HAD hydrolase-like protein [Geminocystis sp. NIES-3709]BAQ63509.1 phosphoglycolate phosphatase [Geminocystis sp. NIES-3709]
MTQKVLIFDFDGTLADSRKTLVHIANKLAGEFGFDRVTEDEIIRLSNLSSREIVQQSPIPTYKIPFLLRRVKKELNQEIKKLQPFIGIKETLNSLKSQGFLLGIVTSNIENNVLDFLKSNQLENHFDFIYSGSSLFGKDKIIKKVIQKHQLLTDHIVYIGDETRDIEAAKKSKIKVVAVTWGFNSAHILAQHNPDFLIHQPQELTEIFNTKNIKISVE